MDGVNSFGKKLYSSDIWYCMAWLQYNSFKFWGTLVIRILVIENGFYQSVVGTKTFSIKYHTTYLYIWNFPKLTQLSRRYHFGDFHGVINNCLELINLRNIGVEILFFDFYQTLLRSLYNAHRWSPSPVYSSNVLNTEAPFNHIHHPLIISLKYLLNEENKRGGGGNCCKLCVQLF